MAEAHIVGQISRGSLKGFPDSLPLCVELSLTFAYEGDESTVAALLFGSYSSRSYACVADEHYVWNHPLSFHVGLKSALIAPRVHLRLVGKGDIELARGSCSFVLKPGLQKYSCLMAKPELSRFEQLSFSFLHEIDRPAGDVCVSCGSIEFELNVVTRNFSTHGIQS